MNMPVFRREGLFLPVTFGGRYMRLTFASRFVLARAIRKELKALNNGPQICRLYSQALIGEMIHDLGGMAGEW